MVNGNYYNIGNPYVRYGTTFKADSQAPLTKPIELVQNTIEEITDKFIQTADEDKNKKTRKKAIAVGSSVLVISTLVAMLNPRYSGKIIGQLKNLQQRTGSKVKTHRTDTLKKNFYQACQKFLDGTVKVAEFTNNINSAKDVGFKWLCAEPRTFSSMENKEAGNILRKVNSGIAKVLRKPYNWITNSFDNISKSTVKLNYKKAAKKMDSFEALAKEYSQKLPANKKAELEAKLQEVALFREYFSETNTLQRLANQEKTMTNLEEDFVKKCISYKRGYRNRFKKPAEHAWNNMSFWAQDIMQPKRAIVEKQGLEAVEKLAGKTGGNKGAYNEILELLQSSLSKEESAQIEKSMNKALKKLNKANYSECVEYFDKKRDLILGSAPTDVLTALVGLGLSGFAISTADSKEERESRLITGVFPVIAGLGASMTFTAMLISGVKSLLMGAATSVVLSGIGSFINRQILGNNQNITSKEAINA